MGTKDSSKTRVAPVFDALFTSDATGGSWVDGLLALGSRSEVVATVAKAQRLVPEHERRWGSNEALLSAPSLLLEYLVHNVDHAQVAASGDEGEVLTKRTALADRDADTVDKALAALRSGKRGRKWFVLEGASRPDALLETDDAIICIEGKRTEAGCTTHTTWMKCRSQLVRHMDAAREAYSSKRVLGLLIVEGDGDAQAVVPSQFWRDECSAQYAPAMLQGSLPHRSESERQEIANGILGVTTWQAICAGNNLPWPPAPDVI
jgi:hypothetical protein